MTAPEIAAMIIGVFTTIVAVASMQFKNMKYVLAAQILSNVLLCTQYVIEGTISAGGIVILAIVQTVLSFVLTQRNKSFPIWLTALFMVGYAVITVVGYTTPFDIVSCVAVWFFALSIVQKRSSVCRVCALMNVILWLIYDIAMAPSAIITHTVIIIFTVAAMIRLDRADWKKLFCKRENNGEQSED